MCFKTCFILEFFKVGHWQWWRCRNGCQWRRRRRWGCAEERWWGNAEERWWGCVDNIESTTMFVNSDLPRELMFISKKKKSVQVRRESKNNAMESFFIALEHASIFYTNLAVSYAFQQFLITESSLFTEELEVSFHVVC